ncbi:hypothetical protein SteCoe_27887 [Stentor coeruleus]|uniref:Uncharacterized protein n=1 Tax=Stentor coeruleus TaxID=5963 RepID=A0A1R2B9J9_9CILI|nr:hypothetical protein SteCoe_27887 [Stentor coeruleus]
MNRDEEDSFLRDLITLIDEAEKNLPEIKVQTVNLVGNTGVGKSTLLCFLLGLRPEVLSNDYGQVVIDFNQTESEKIIIGHTGSSCTVYPNLRKINGINYWDLPGFCDNKSIAQEIVNFYCTKKIFDSAREFKIVLVIEYNSLFLARGKNLAETLKQLIEMFPDQKSLFNSLSIVVMKCGNFKFVNENFINCIVKLSQENNEFEIARPLINMLSECPKKIVIFKIPQNEEDLNDMLRSEIETCINNSRYCKMSIVNSFSYKAKLMIEKLVKYYEAEVEEKMHDLANYLIKIFSLEKDLNKLELGKNILDEFLSHINTFSRTFDLFKNGLKKLFENFIECKVLFDAVDDIINKLCIYNNYRSEISSSNILINCISSIFKARLAIESYIYSQKVAIMNEQTEMKEKARKDQVKNFKLEINALEKVTTDQKSSILNLEATIDNLKIEKNDAILRKKHKNATKKKKYAEEIAKKNDEIINLNEKLRALTSQKINDSCKIEFYAKDIQNQNSKINELKEKISILSTQQSKDSASLKIYDECIKKKKLKINELKKKNSIASELNLKDSEIIKQLTNDIEIKNKKIQEYEKEIKNSNEQLQNLKISCNTLSKKNDQYTSLMRDAAEFNSIKRLKNGMDNLGLTYKECSIF